jgi:SprT protein
MDQLTRNQTVLHKYIPEKAVPVIAEWIYKYDFKLKIKKSRTTKLGDYRSPYNGKNHIITINYDMNKYAFLITLVHEIAHLCNYEEHKHRVKPHGAEWKEHYQRLMHQFLHTEIFPTDVVIVLKNYMSNPAASSCSDLDLLRILKKYDANSTGVSLEELDKGVQFVYKNILFVKGERVRKRFKCAEVDTGRLYLFNPLAEVEPVA